ncbi:AI-2E family transporter [Gluconobacter kondonii]|uniref:AI-2E family transporter n=1 Tax=Gluconobacter kondonii TaxID=941463 RepID=A0ABQ5WN03_9PROT|nr:AI-2E family transporter [Gluconobacter kondonii]MBN3866241.1 AI-2E family transporter [Gluconobacter kondonii]MBS1052070.1 AI-2E family transporter [Gluconobacter kondonii]MBS1055324.1 AI-2E family transporter [Gluconobacter kondonii]MBS1064459.1 AI-2E family transporter [Gluconobacter kondonii]MBS1079657.1 AI-2E family transporter [Gluconobacter kondonii]
MRISFSDPAERSETEPRARELSKIAGLMRITLALTLMLLAIWLIGDVLAVIFASALVAVVLHGLARMLRRHVPVIPYQGAVALVTVAILVAMIGLGWSSGPSISDQFIRLKQALITQSGELRSHLSGSTIGQMVLDHLPSSLGGNAPGTGGLGSLGSGLAGSVTGLLSSVFGILGTLLVVLIAGLYFALSPAVYIDGMIRLVPTQHRPAARELMLTAGSTLWAWTAGQALDMLVVGILSGVGLSLIGVPLALALGVVAGLCNFIPYIGAILGAVPAVLLGLSLGTHEGLFVAILYCVIQFFEGNVLAPLIQRRAVHMPPAMAILSQTVFGSILGAPGLILASPITAALLAMGDKATAPLEDENQTRRDVGEVTEEEEKQQK